MNLNFFKAAVLLFLCSLGQAHAFELFPIRLYVDASRNVATLSVTNTTDREITLQPRVFNWKQENSANSVPVDKLTDATEFTIFPPIVQLKAGAKQTIRIRYNGEFDKNIEKAFRVITEELVIKPIEGQINYAKAISIALFVRSKVDAAPKLNWEVKKLDNGLMVLNIDNSESDKHIQITGISTGATDEPAHPPVNQSLFVYLLPKSRGSMPLNLKLAAGQHSIKLANDYKEFEQTITVK
jgi:P pilus assembly chaperone PapD